MDHKGVMLLQRDVVATEAKVQLKISDADPVALALCLLAIQTCYPGPDVFDVIVQHLDHTASTSCCGASDHCIQTVCELTQDISGGQDRFKQMVRYAVEMANKQLQLQGMPELVASLLHQIAPAVVDQALNCAVESESVSLVHFFRILRSATAVDGQLDSASDAKPDRDRASRLILKLAVCALGEELVCAMMLTGAEALAVKTAARTACTGQRFQANCLCEQCGQDQFQTRMHLVPLELNTVPTEQLELELTIRLKPTISMLNAVLEDHLVDIEQLAQRLHAHLAESEVDTLTIKVACRMVELAGCFISTHDFSSLEDVCGDVLKKQTVTASRRAVWACAKNILNKTHFMHMFKVRS